MGRKNFLFANTPQGAQASAIAYSLLETAKENGLNPYEYLCFLFSELPNRTEPAIEAYLPGGSLVPKDCHCVKTEEMPLAVRSESQIKYCYSPADHFGWRALSWLELTVTGKLLCVPVCCVQ